LCTDCYVFGQYASCFGNISLNTFYISHNQSFLNEHIPLTCIFWGHMPKKQSRGLCKKTKFGLTPNATFTYFATCEMVCSILISCGDAFQIHDFFLQWASLICPSQKNVLKLEIPQYRTICSKLGNTINPNNPPPPKIQTLSKVEKLGLLVAFINSSLAEHNFYSQFLLVTYFGLGLWEGKWIVKT